MSKKKEITVKLHIVDIAFDDGDDGIALTFPNGADCLEEHGFGLFLTKWKKGEVTITKKAKEFIMINGRQMDLGGVEFFENSRIGFMQPVMAKDEISVNGSSKQWIGRLPEAA